MFPLTVATIELVREHQAQLRRSAERRRRQHT